MRCRTCDRNGYYGTEMFYDNTLPISELCQEWMDTETRPDWWDYHKPLSNVAGHTFPVETLRWPAPEELERVYYQLVLWLIRETAFDQLYRQPQVSHHEIKFVWDWLLTMEVEDATLEVPGHLHGFGMFTLQLEYCCWHADVRRYPSYMIDEFTQAGWQLNPTNVTNDLRHPRHQQYISRFLAKHKEPTHVAPTGQSDSSALSGKTGNPHLDMLNELMRD